jgi:aromatic ring-cleaving dioxygenase
MGMTPAKKAPFHAHIYYEMSQRSIAAELRARFQALMPTAPELTYVGELRDRNVGPHPLPQFEIHFLESMLSQIRDIIKATGLRALLHPLTDDDLADHTSLANWVGEPLDLDLTVLDPPGKNQGIARFSKSDF